MSSHEHARPERVFHSLVCCFCCISTSIVILTLLLLLTTTLPYTYRTSCTSFRTSTASPPPYIASTAPLVPLEPLCLLHSAPTSTAHHSPTASTAPHPPTTSTAYHPSPTTSTATPHRRHHHHPHTTTTAAHSPLVPLCLLLEPLALARCSTLSRVSRAFILLLSPFSSPAFLAPFSLVLRLLPSSSSY